MNRFCPSPMFAFVCGGLLAAGCSSRAVETSHTPRPPATVTAANHSRSGAPARRATGPIPEVITKAKPFRLAAALPTQAASDRPGVPALMNRPVAADHGARAATAGVSSRDTAGIRNLITSYLKAFNRHDPAALAAHWSEAGENVDLDSGVTTAGREAVQQVFATLFEEDAGATIDIDLQAIRQLRDDVAVVDGVSRISFTDAPPSASRFSAVVVRSNGGWMLDSVRESTVPVEQLATPRSARPLDALAWLLGSWEDASEGVTASIRCGWSPNKAFLVRHHLITTDPAPTARPQPGDTRIPGLLPAAGNVASRELTEIIGWDESRREIRSWFFSSDGRSAQGSWSREGQTWTVRCDTDAGEDRLYTLAPAGPDELTCVSSSTVSSSTRLSDLLPPACDYLRTARMADSGSDDVPTDR
jgi:uncharacterized protein (TIGR02246 family)